MKTICSVLKELEGGSEERLLFTLRCRESVLSAPNSLQRNKRPQLLQSKNVLPRSGATLMPLRSVESGAGGGGVHAAAGCCASGGTVPTCRSGHGCAVWLLSHRAHTWCCFQTRFVAPVLVPCQTAASPAGSASGRRGPL